jgi:hypothetical protein
VVCFDEETKVSSLKFLLLANSDDNPLTWEPREISMDEFINKTPHEARKVFLTALETLAKRMPDLSLDDSLSAALTDKTKWLGRIHTDGGIEEFRGMS